jgi:hypothetical protein
METVGCCFGRENAVGFQKTVRDLYERNPALFCAKLQRVVDQVPPAPRGGGDCILTFRQRPNGA